MAEKPDYALDPALLELQQEYVREAPARLAELSKDLAAFRNGEPDAIDSLKTRFHRLAGSGGSYGLPRVTEIARAMEQRILTDPPPEPAESELFENAIQDLRVAFDSAAADAEMPLQFGRIPGFGYRTLLMMGESELRARMIEGLNECGFEVDVHETEVDPWSVSVSARPDLVVVGADAGDEPLTLARHWAAPTADRPRAVVVADPNDQFDRLQLAATGVDAIFGESGLPRGLTQFARGLAQIGAPPAKVLVVEDDPSQSQLFAAWLGQINAGVTICQTAERARQLLAHETPDIVLLDVDLPDVDGFAIARLMRQEPRLALVPIVFLTARHTMDDEMEGLRAGGDDFMVKPVDRNHLLQVVRTRTERGRRIREMVHRDGLTGVLNHATLMAELEHAVAFAKRHGEPICFLMLDLDHFKRINDTHGHMIGDQVLMHVARVFRKVVRHSDLLGRYGGEEFGVILRRCPPANGRQIAEKLRQSLAESPMVLRNGEEITLRVSIGVSSYPGSGESGADLCDAADRALYRAKSAGRNRVEMG